MFHSLSLCVSRETEQMHISMLTAVVVCVLAHGKERCAQEARKKKRIRKKERRKKKEIRRSFLHLSLVSIITFFPFSFMLLIMRTMIQPSHRTVCSTLPFLIFKKKEKKEKRAPTNGPSCACSEHAPKTTQREQRNKAKKKKREGLE